MASARRLRLLRYSLACALIFIIVIQTAQGGSPNPAQPHPTASLTEWAVPTARSGPWTLALDSSGNCCWFVEYYANKVGHLDPGTGSIQEWNIPSLNSNPYDIVLTTINGTVTIWGTEFSSDKVFAFIPATGQFSEYSLPQGSGPAYIAIEPESSTIRVWFTEITKNSNGEFVYDPNSRNVTFYDAPFPSIVGGGAYGLYAGAGYVWFAGFSSLVRWDRASGQYSIWPLANNSSTVVRSLAFDSSGGLWYTQGSARQAGSDNFVGVLHSSIVQEWRLPSPGANPWGLSINPLTQQPWIAEQSPIQDNGTVANLNDFGNGTTYPSSPMTAPSISTATVLAPTISRVFPSNYSVTPTTGSVAGSSLGPFTEYRLGNVLPSHVITDSSGNIWVTETGAGLIVRLSPSNPDYALTPTSFYASLAQGSSVHLAVNVTSMSGYAGNVTLTAPELPHGIIRALFDPNPVYVPSGGSASSNLEITAAPGTPPGTDSLTIEGSDGRTRHTISLLLTVTNGTVTNPGQELETRCLLQVPIYLPQSTLLVGLLIDVLIGAIYVALPLKYFSRKIRLTEALGRNAWLIILLSVPTLLSLISAVLLIC
ncbi:MAG TPA: hypothetical protein VEG61_04090 [Candidatus Dormibacteraeota bacterium]|nr:hypothetical protein [Candidatus Dormibacteraeota bacterium]